MADLKWRDLLKQCGHGVQVTGSNLTLQTLTVNLLSIKKNGAFKALSQALFTRKDFISEKEKGTCLEKTSLETQKEQPILCIVC